MLKTPFGPSVSFLRSWGTAQLLRLKHRASPLRRHQLALASAAVALAAGAAWGLCPRLLRPAPPATAQPRPRPTSRVVQPALPGYLVIRGGAPGVDISPPQLSSRSGGRPTVTASPPPPTSTPTPKPKQITTYQVAAGDTVSGLAERFGISAETIVWANGLAGGGTLQPGQALTILPVSGVLHKVRPGDTLSAIARAYEAEPQAIVEANALANPDSLSIDQALAIPGGRPLPPPTPVPTAAPQLLALAPPTPEGTTAATPAPGAQPAADASAKGAEIVAIAARYLGYPYAYGGSSPATGFDCSGFTWFVYAQAGIGIPRTSYEQPAAGPAVAYDALLPGDLVFFAGTYGAGISHVGVYVGAGRFINAANYTEGVCYGSLGDAYWAACYWGACRPWP